MNAALLRLACRDGRGVRRWVVPGFSDPVVLRPAAQSALNAPSLSWLAHGFFGTEDIRTARLDWHKAIAQREIRALIERG